MVRINGFGMGLSLVIFVLALWMAYNFGRSGKLIGQ